MNRAMRRASAGFTLLEMVIALAIFALLSVMAYGGLTAVLAARERLVEENRKWRDVAMFLARFQADLAAIANRPIRDSYDIQRLALEGNPELVAPEDATIALTRLGYPGLSGTLSGVQRLGYRLRGQTVEQLIWPAPDQAPRAVPAVNAVLQGVNGLDLQYLDRNGQWQLRWPQTRGDRGLPLAIQLTLDLAGGERITRTFALPFQ